MNLDRRWVERVGKLLAGAEKQHSAAFSSLDSLKLSIDRALRCVEDAPVDRAPGADPGTWRDLVMSQVALKRKHFGLEQEAQAFVYAAGHQVVEQLSDAQLVALNRWLEQWMQPDCNVGDLIGALA